MKFINNQTIQAYKYLRMMIGLMGILLPLVLLEGGYANYGIVGMTSISAYHFTPYTSLDDYFAGTLFAIGAFLAFYPGYAWPERIISFLAWIFAWGVALCPTAPDCGASLFEIERAHIHRSLAAGFFICLILFCFFFCLPISKALEHRINAKVPKLIVKVIKCRFLGIWTVAQNEQYGNWKRARNITYCACAIVMMVCMYQIYQYQNTKPDFCKYKPHFEFWRESAAVWAFSIAWLVKGYGN